MGKLHFIFQGLYDILVVIFLPTTLLLPRTVRKRFLRWSAPWSYSLVLRLLFPAYLRETQRVPTWKKALWPETPPKDLIFAFGGNDETQAELESLLDGALFFHEEPFTTSVKPILTVPLVQAYSEEEYLALTKRHLQRALALIDGQTIERIQVLGHSLGGAIAVQLIPFFIEMFPKAAIFLTLDRTFSSLATTAKSQYGLGGWILESTLGLLWELDSVQALRSLTPISNLSVTIIQVTPDHVLGQSLLSEEIRDLPRPDWDIYYLKRPAGNTLHAQPFSQLNIPSYPKS